jgi:hypothetical protein
MSYRINYDTDHDFMSEPGFGAEGAISRARDLAGQGRFPKVYDEAGFRVDPRTLERLDARGRRSRN